jgi:hypothetical protein
MKTSLLVLALLLSSASLAMQIKRAHATGPFDSYMGPAKTSDFDWRVFKTNQDMMRVWLDMRGGVGAPVVSGLNDDRSRLIVKVAVYEDALPKDHNERNRLFNLTCQQAIGSVSAVFNPKQDALSLVDVQFMSLGDVARGIDGPYADCADGVLKFRSEGSGATTPVQ